MYPGRGMGVIACVITLFSLQFPRPVNAATSTVPNVIRHGLDAYAAQNSPRAALKLWLADSPLATVGQFERLVSELKRIHGLCGSFTGDRTLQQVNLSPAVQIVYLELDYQQCPIFVRFIIYQKGQSWVVTQLLMNAKPEAVLPGSMLARP